MTDLPSGPRRSSHGISFSQATRVWALIGLNSFGGPAGQISVMHRMLVEQLRWFSERRFLHALNYCMLLPGPEATQLATYFGWLLHGVRGGLVAGSLFVLPGFVTILVLSILYAGFGELTVVEAIFYGVKPAVMAIVATATIRIGQRALQNRLMMAVAAAAFVGIFFLDIPFPFIVLGAGALGYIGGRMRPGAFASVVGHESGEAADPAPAPLVSDDIVEGRKRPPARRSVIILAIGLAVWLGPVAALAVWLGTGSVYVQEGFFFSTAAVVTFGGAYAVLAYVAQQAVQVYGWLAPGEMLDGLGMAESTPGPLIMVVQFVGFMGAYRAADGLDPMVAGVAGAVVVTWVTFAPCFLWIFLGAPYIEHLRGNRSFSSALSSVTAAVVGVILNLAVWFSLHTVFGQVDEVRTFGLRLYTPEPGTADPIAAVLAAGALYLLVRRRWSMLATLGICVVVGAAIHLVFLTSG